MLVLFETPAGFALFQLLDEDKLNSQNLASHFEDAEKAKKLLVLKHFTKFEDTTEALKSATSVIEGKLPSNLKRFLRKHAKGQKLAVGESALGRTIHEKLGLDVISTGTNVGLNELMRGIRSLLPNLLGENIKESDLNTMALGLAHSLGRYKLKFSPDKVDTMIVQAVSLLGDLDKELNIYCMRVKEWYGWHFPEMSRIIVDNHTYAKVIVLMGMKENAPNIDFSSLLDEAVTAELVRAAQISMGTEITQNDLTHIQDLCTQISEMTDYKNTLSDYVKNRMRAIAPNLSVLVGELVGAKLIAHSGSLMNLAKHPSSTIQLLGAEKALFRALKTKTGTPKYGLIFHATLVGQTAPNFRGKISRVLANKTALSIRYDALGGSDDVNPTVGLQHLESVQQRIKSLEGGNSYRISGKGKSQTQTKSYRKPDTQQTLDTSSDFKGLEKDDQPVEEVPIEPVPEKKRKRESGGGEGGKRKKIRKKK
eukprot:TRINITY_DN6120_c0_g1_i1.p1 TRINITY_DN6120_c0_g1~~TRINITY_DN6120_c0_g1_i1.p1  ORF type:complete len:480 (-),score=102.93 TRINITY_DN6120_c0_g1_i1:97-1536(-)